MDRRVVISPLKYSLTAEDTTSAPEVPAFIPLIAGPINFFHKLPATRRVAAGTFLVEQGSASGSVHLIKRGLVKLIHLNARGRETNIGLRSDGWYAGSVSALLRLPNVCSVRTVTECTVITLPGTQFSHCLREHPEMMIHFLEGLCFEVASQASLNAEIMSGNAEDRLDHFMRERESSHPLRAMMDPLPVLKQMEVAQLLSITPEHLSRLMTKRSTALRAMSPPRRPTPVKAAGQLS